MKLDMSIRQYAEKIAKYRHNEKLSYKKKMLKDIHHELIGVIGELVYGYYTNEVPNLAHTVGGDLGFDFSKGVQVKSSHPNSKYLIEFIDVDFKVFDVYVFVHVNLFSNTGKIVGWIYRKDFLLNCEIKDFGYGDRYALHIDKLNPSWI